MHFKVFLKRILCLSGRLTALIAIPSFLLVALVLYQDRHDALAYAAYLLSAYGLAVALTWAFRSLKAVLSGMVAFIIAHNASYEYPGTLIFLMAAYTFYMFILAIVNLVRFRKYGSPLLSAVKAIGMTAALVSMLSLETAMLDQFGGDDPARFRATMIGVTGAVICAVVLIMSVVMIVRSGTVKKSVVGKHTKRNEAGSRG